MNQGDDAIWALLGRVGLTRKGGSLDALADPAATDALAALLADRLRPCELSVVIVWEGLQSVVLGYAVGLRLGVPVVVLSDDEGLVSSSRPIIADTRVALVAATPLHPSMTRMATGYLESWDAELVVTATLLGRPDDAAGTVALAELPPDESVRAILTHTDAAPTPGPAQRQDRR